MNLILEVPSDPLTYWNLEPVLDWTASDEAKPEPTRPNTEETLWNKTLQQQHDQAYQEAILLPGSIPFKFTGLNNMPSFCYLRIIDNYQGKVVVIASDPGNHAENTGTSITNAAGLVASQVCHEFKIPADKLYWIERYVRTSAIHPHGNAPNWDFEETWDRVTFSRQDNRLIAPQWQPLEREAVAQIKAYIFG